MLRIYLEKYPNDVKVLLRVAELFMDLRKVSEIDETCTKILNISSEDITVLRRVARIYKECSRLSPSVKRKTYFLEKTIKVLRKCCNLQPDYHRNWLDLAEAYSRLYAITGERSNLEEAIKCIEEVVKRHSSWTFLKELGELYLQKGDKEKALECFYKADEMRVKEYPSL